MSTPRSNIGQMTSRGSMNSAIKPRKNNIKLYNQIPG